MKERIKIPLGIMEWITPIGHMPPNYSQLPTKYFYGKIVEGLLCIGKRPIVTN
ncbi:hypothetical protein KO561_11360 [Radiobacillus kanasensis]|uniref:hypothetical protein n=1 Tax=Radiobacillus kanasensis TaxID=2844358 RepID=UPI001E4C0683|nr:hypothetical protein [Radiobacillus kanasensis]UFT97812.1 hypothetical protein KO561_11360 [Radiobacillus kanasensis]